MRGQQNRFTRGNNRSDSHNAANLAKFKVGDIVKGTVKVRNIVVIFHLRRLLRKNVTEMKKQVNVRAFAPRDYKTY